MAIQKSGPQPKFTPEQVAAAILGAKGLVSKAAKKLKCDEDLIRRYIQEYPMVRGALSDARERMGDEAESKLFANIEAGEQRAIEFYLRTIFRQRGYSERTEVTGADGAPLNVSIIRVDSRKPSE